MKGLWLTLSFMMLAVLLKACSSTGATTGSVTVVTSGRFDAFEGFVHIPPDSVAELYRRYDHDRFYRQYGPDVNRAAVLIDSLNGDLPADRRVDTLSIEFSPDQFGTAVKTAHSIYLSSGFFFVYNDPSVIRSILFHEYGHAHFEILRREEQESVARIWGALRRGALLYVFVDGEYSGNARFGGHPDESPGELFASAFNLFHNRPDEVRARLRFVPSGYYGMIDSLKRDTGVTWLVLFD